MVDAPAALRGGAPQSVGQPARPITGLLPPPCDAAPPLIGRAADLDVLRSFLARAADHGEALLLTGAAGIGKSLLLEEACRSATAADTRLLRAAGVQFEADVSHAGLNQLLLPLHDDLAALPDLHRDALTGALGTGPGLPTGRLVVSAAALALLRHAARSAPVLLVVDDLQWLDRSSAHVLGFIARRLKGSRVGLLAAVRTESDCFLLTAGLPQHDVAPLDDEASDRLLQDRFPTLAAPVRRRVMSLAMGNPLALAELPVTMTDAQRRADEPLPAVLPLSGQLQGLFTDRVRGLPALTRELLLLTSLDGTGDLRLLRAAAPGDSWLDGLAPAERDRLVRVDTAADRIVLRHPLLGAAAVELATSAERRRAHAVLADLLTDDPERRAWHLAAAVVGPDDRAADLLELAAHRALQRGDAVGAVHALLRSADLSCRGAERARRLAEAAYVGADAAGQLHSVPRLLGQARQATPGTAEPLEVTVAAAHHLLNGEGDVATAHLMLVSAIDNALDQGHRGAALHEALHSLMLVCHFSGREEPWHAVEAVLRRLGPDAPPLLSVSYRTWGDPARTTPPVLEELRGWLARSGTEIDPTRIVRLAAASFYVDLLPACRPALWRVLRNGREGGAAASAVNALMMLCHDAYRDGRWDDAARMAQEGVAWSEQLGYRLLALPGMHCLAMIAAARGDAESTRELTDELVAWGAPRGVTMLQQLAARARALAALGRGEYEDAYRLASSVSPPGRLTPHVPAAPWAARDLVEAAVRVGRTDEAAAHVAAMRQCDLFRLRPRLALLAAASAALAAPADEADSLYRAALALSGAEQFPFERARVQLAYGEYLRRTRAAHAARNQLTAALQTFERLDARPWIARTSHELRISGRTERVPTADRARATLTAQEYEVASLAAAGLSNKEIGTRLYLSPRTVSGHLYRIFPKLGVVTRAALRDALTAGPGRATDPPGPVAHVRPIRSRTTH
jgi:DNA-binding CsgD family transcriptional regulator